MGNFGSIKCCTHTQSKWFNLSSNGFKGKDEQINCSRGCIVKQSKVLIRVNISISVSSHMLLQTEHLTNHFYCLRMTECCVRKHLYFQAKLFEENLRFHQKFTIYSHIVFLVERKVLQNGWLTNDDIWMDVQLYKI